MSDDSDLEVIEVNFHKSYRPQRDYDSDDLLDPEYDYGYDKNLSSKRKREGNSACSTPSRVTRSSLKKANIQKNGIETVCLSDSDSESKGRSKKPNEINAGDNHIDELLDPEIDLENLVPSKSRDKGTGATNENDDNFSDVTEKVDSDEQCLSDPESLPSIPSPLPTSSQSSRRSHARGKKLDTVYDNNHDEDIAVVSVSKPENSSPNTKTKYKNVVHYSDPAAQDIDDIFQDLEYSSLADFLAAQEKKKGKPELSQNSSGSGSSVQTASSSSASTTVPKPKTKTAPKPTVPSESEPAEPISYRVDPKKYRKPKSPSQKRKAKAGKDSGSQSSSQTSSSSAGTSAQMSRENSQNPPSSMASCSSTSSRKGYKPGDVKTLTLHIPTEVCSNELASSLLEKEVQFQVVDKPELEGLITFERKLVADAFDRCGQPYVREWSEVDQNVIVFRLFESLLRLLQNELTVIDKDSDFSGRGPDEECLTEWIRNMKRQLPEKKITVIIQGQEAYNRKMQRAKQKEYRDRIMKEGQEGNGRKKRAGKNRNDIVLSNTEIQSAFIHAKLHTRMDIRFCEKTSILSDLIYGYTKAIAEAPFKQAKINQSQDQFDWYAVADSVGGVPVDEDRRGMKSLWIAQLSTFQSVGQSCALAIGRVYKSPRMLLETYEKCRTSEEGKNLLTDIPVTMGVGPLAKTRKIGPEASKKIYRFFTSTDGELEIN